MNEYNRIIQKAEIALNNGDYKYCIETLKPLSDVIPISTKEGINLRYILITALSGINNKDEAIFFCKQLMKSKYSHIRLNAKSQLEILNSPALKTPKNWVITLENKSEDKTIISKSQNNNITSTTKERFIKISDVPTGETQSFQKGFTFIVAVLLFLITLLLSSCVKIESNLDLRDLGDINITYIVKSKFESKIPWQINFENELKKIYDNNAFTEDKKEILLINKQINITEAESALNKFLEAASESTETDFKDIEFKYNQKNYFIAKRYSFDIDINLLNLERIDNLEILINILSPSKVEILNDDDDKNINLSENKINWKLNPGEINHLSFKFLYWNKILISTFLTLIVVCIAYIIRRNRYELGSNLPELPS